MIFRHFSPTPCRAALLAIALGWLTGCVQYQARPLVPEKTAAVLGARSLNDDGLRRFLSQNLGHEPVPWPPPVWNFEMLSWVAFYYQPSLEVARAQWSVARAAVKTAAARPNPTLSLTPGYDTNSSGTSPWFPSINLDFLLETAGKRDHRTTIERLTAESARLDVLSAAWQVRSELRRALIEVSALDRRQTLLREQVGLERQTVALLQQRVQAGMVAAPEISSAQMSLLKAEAAAADVERQAPLARNRVAQILGVQLAALEGIRLDDMLAAPGLFLSLDEITAARRLALQSRADVLAALARYEASQAALQWEVARQYPDLHLGPGYQYDLGENKWSLALTFELPLFNRNEGPLAEAEARRREAAAEFTAVQARAIAEIDGAAAAQTAAAGQLVHLRRLQEELEKQSTFMEARLAAGEADKFESQNAKIELTLGSLALLDAEAGAIAAAGQLEDALQVPIGNLPAAVALSTDASQAHLP
jgi:outer membrane protein, heavy metal efflux system